MFKRSERFSFRKPLPKQKITSHSFILRFQKSDPQAGGPKYSVVAGKKVSKKAVLRNRAKRIFRECLKEVLAKISNSYDLVFFLRLPAQEYQKSGIIDELEKTFTSITHE